MKCLKYFEWIEMNYVWLVMCNFGKEFMELIMIRILKKCWIMNIYLFIIYFYNFFEKYLWKKNKLGFVFFYVNVLLLSYVFYMFGF